MPIADEVLELVPVGEKNAVSSRLLWQQLGKWASTSVTGQLNKMVSQGLIRSKIEGQDGMLVRLYYRPIGEPHDR